MIIDLSKLESGFCDKLKKITFCLTIARYKKIKTIKIFDRCTKENPFLFYDLCRIQNFKIVKLFNLKKNFIDPFNFNEFNLQLDKKTCKNFKPKNIYISDSSFLKKWKKSYQFIKPKKKIEKKINKIINNKKLSLGLHSRLTDKFVSIKEKLLELPYKDTITKGEYDYILNLLPNFVRKYKKNFIYIASDSLAGKNEIIKKIILNCNKILINNSKFHIKKFRQTSGEDFIIDLFILSKCSIIYSSGGGVPMTAKLLSKKKVNLKFWKANFFIILTLNDLSKIVYLIRVLFLNKIINFCKFNFSKKQSKF